MNSGPVKLLEALHDAGAVISPRDDGFVGIRIEGGVPANLRRLCSRWRWLLVWGVHGAENGYRWFGCPVCGWPALSKKPGKTCLMTFECTGRTEEIPLPRFVPGPINVVVVPESAVR